MATKKTTTTATNDEIQVLRIEKGRTRFGVLGTTPLIQNCMSEKVKRELLLPKGKKNAAEKASTLKHSPLDEYRASPYKTSDPDAATRIVLPSTAFKGALRSVAVDMPGAAKAQIGRLTYVEGHVVPIFGVPQIFMSVTRSADMNRTPDIRTRCIIPNWAAIVEITYVIPLLREQTVATLFAAAGIMRGVGDWRPEKGSGSYGQFELVNLDDTRFLDVLSEGGKDAQDAALAEPHCYDEETRELLSWYDVEAARRGFKVAA